MAINKDNKKEVIQTFSIIGLITVVLGLLIVTNFYFTEKLNRLEAQNNANYTRIVNIENFLNAQIDAATKANKDNTKTQTEQTK
ncbi:MAG: hypothetical protein PHR00_01340 [Patescibacteria group bacterium]|nr:hypothetical protein [Patescibacteria group bacterium]